MEPAPRAEAEEIRPNAWDVLAEAARAIHAETDPRRLSEWVVEHARRGTTAEACGLWLTDEPRPLWVTAGTPAADPSLLGDPRS